MQNETLRDRIVDILEDRKAEDIEIIAIEKRSTLADEFVICNGNSNTHVRSIAQELIHKMETEYNTPVLHEEGLDTNRWILLDYGTIVVHIFHPQEREFYSLDKLWRESK